MLQSRTRLAVENLFLRKQFGAVYRAAGELRRGDDAARVTLVALSRLVNWRRLLVIVKPDTLIRWHRKGCRLFWRWKSKAPGRPRIPKTSGSGPRRWRRRIGHGRGTDRRGALREAWDSCVAANGSMIYAAVRHCARGPGRRRGALCAESRTGRAGVRFLRRGHRHVLHGARLRGPRRRSMAEWTAQQFRMIVAVDEAHR
jgi:hypothetical protein